MPSPATWINDSTRAKSLAFVREQRVDVIVIGGGITGAGVALDAASRGLSVALLESHDLASGTSRWSSKLVHGGLRYLAKGDVAVAWESAVERARLMTVIAPHLARPIGFLVPGLRDGSRIEFALSAIGTLLADGLRRLTGLSGSILPRPRHVSARAAHAIAPAIPAARMHGGVVYWDGQLEDDARLVLGVARTAAGYGAHILRDVSAVSATANEVLAEDRRSGESLNLSAGVVINATGVWAAEIEPRLRVLPSRGTHLIVRSERLGHPAVAYTAAVPGHFGRFVFVLPQPDGLCYIGLTDVEDRVSDGRSPVAPEEDIRFLLAIVNASMNQPLHRDDVVGTFAGLRPLVSTAASSADVSRRHLVLDRPGRPITIVGGKLTTYRRMAEDAVDAAVGRLSSGGAVCRTQLLPLVGAATAAELAALDAPARLVRRYGTEATAVARLGAEHPELAGPLCAGCAVTGEELLFGVLAEGATTVEDLLERRTRLAFVAEDAERARPRAERVLARARELV